MRTVQRCSAALTILVGLFCAPSNVAAQAPNGLTLGGVVSGSLVDGGAAPALSVTLGYGFTPRLALEVDASFMPTHDFGDFPNCPPNAVCVRGGSHSLRRQTGWVSGSLVTRLPGGTPRLRPYLTAGGGVAHVRREVRDNDLPIQSSAETNGPMLTAGGGVEFGAGPRLSAAFDVRYQRIFENDARRLFVEPDPDLVRIGCSVRYRF
jgi:hypothetical protein